MQKLTLSMFFHLICFEVNRNLFGFYVRTEHVRLVRLTIFNLHS